MGEAAHGTAEVGSENSGRGTDEKPGRLRIPDMNDPKRMDVIGLLGPLRRYARSLTRNETQAEDLVQDTLVRAYERRGSFRAGGNLRGWLLSILHNTFIDTRRSHLADISRLEHVSALAETAAPPDQESRVRLQQIRAAFMSLPDEQRAALHLVAIEGLSYQEAATALAIPIGTLMSRLGRARSALRAFEAGDAVTQPSQGKPRPNLRIIGGSDV
jgi:RNA polymerase sigma-70 factor (ECF subfamily)